MKRSMPKSPSHILLASCFWCIHLLCLVERCKVQAQTNFTTDRGEARTLNAIFQHWGLSAAPDDWNISGNPCSGTAVDSTTISNPGIKCDCQSNGGGTCHITEMSVQGWATAWVIPEELRNLTFLTNLVVSRNNIEGSLPSFIGNFKHLSYLDISDNNFNGPLPPEIGTLPSLEHLDVSQNYMTGPLPASIGNLKNLSTLDVSKNNITGPLPASIGNLTNLTTLDLSFNRMEGSLPSFISNFRHLSYLDIKFNNFNGPLPPEIGTLPSLEYLDISYNGFNRLIPPELGNLSSLQVLLVTVAIQPFNVIADMLQNACIQDGGPIRKRWMKIGNTATLLRNIPNIIFV